MCRPARRYRRMAAKSPRASKTLHGGQPQAIEPGAEGKPCQGRSPAKSLNPGSFGIGIDQVDRYRGVGHDFFGHTAEIGALLIQILLAAAMASQHHHVGLGFLDRLQNLAGGCLLYTSDAADE